MDLNKLIGRQIPPDVRKQEARAIRSVLADYEGGRTHYQLLEEQRKSLEARLRTATDSANSKAADMREVLQGLRKFSPLQEMDRVQLRGKEEVYMVGKIKVAMKDGAGVVFLYCLHRIKRNGKISQSRLRGGYYGLDELVKFE